MAEIRSFTFFDLPRELRDIVYYHAVVEPPAQDETSEARNAIDLASTTLPPICLASKQTAAESLSIYFKYNKVAINADHTGKFDLRAQHSLFFSQLGDAIIFRHLELRVQLLPPPDSRFVDPAMGRFYTGYLGKHCALGECDLLQAAMYRPPLTGIAVSGMIANANAAAEEVARRRQCRGWTLAELRQIANVYAQDARRLCALQYGM